MDGENNGSKPYEHMDDLGVSLFLGWHPHASHNGIQRLDQHSTSPYSRSGEWPKMCSAKTICVCQPSPGMVIPKMFFL